MTAKAFVETALASFAGDPADTEFQAGYLAALKEVQTQLAVDGGIEEAAQALLASAGAPLARTAELLGAVQGAAVRSVLEARIAQIVEHGHDAEYDAMLAIGRLPRVARDLIGDALDMVDGSSERRNLPIARKRLARAGAVLLAAIDRLDMVKA